MGAAPASASAPTVPTVTGSIIELGYSSFTLQTNGRRVGVINALTSAATRVTAEDTPYVWGGGHGQAGVASVGVRGPGYNGRRVGFDCSGAVAAVLAAAGLWPAGAGVPADNGVIAELLAQHLIARGVGATPDSVNLYDEPGVHIFMNIDGRFFGTSDGGGGGDAKGGAGWLSDGAWDASDPAFKKYHFLPSVLAQRTSYGNDYTFNLAPDGLFPATSRNDAVSLGTLGIADLLVNERVRVSYRHLGSGAMSVESIAVLGGGPKLGPPPTPAPPTVPTTPDPGTPPPPSSTPDPGTPTSPGAPAGANPAPGPSAGESSSVRTADSGGAAMLTVTGGASVSGAVHRPRAGGHHHRHHH